MRRDEVEYYSYEDRAREMHERTMELILIQVDSVMDELQQLALFVDEIEDDSVRTKMDELVIRAMNTLDKI